MPVHDSKYVLGFTFTTDNAIDHLLDFKVAAGKRLSHSPDLPELSSGVITHGDVVYGKTTQAVLVLSLVNNSNVSAWQSPASKCSLLHKLVSDLPKLCCCVTEYSYFL